MNKFGLVLFVFLGISACKTETVQTFGQQVAAKIQAENQTLKATRAIIFTGSTSIDSGDFTIDDEFLLVGTARYNLNRLVGYKLYNSAGTPTLAAYF